MIEQPAGTERKSRNYRPEAAKQASQNGHSPASTLPPIRDAYTLISTALTLPPEIIVGILHKCCKLVLGGGSKSFKTWTLLDLAISVATGMPWLGFPTVKGKVLYLNFELMEGFFSDRLRKVASAKGARIEAGMLDTWHLRGYSDLNAITMAMIEKAKTEKYSMVIIDPFYKLAAGLDENAAGDISMVLAKIDRMAEETGAAIVYGHHFSKGNQAAKESMDRMSGSGVFARDADAIITLTAHEQEFAYAVDLTLRNTPPVEPFVLRWQAPLMLRDDGLSPEKLKKPKMGRSKQFADEDVLKVLSSAGELSASEWARACNEELGMGERTFFQCKKRLAEAKKAIPSIVNPRMWIAK